MLPPAPVPPNVIVGATIVKRFPGYGERRGTIGDGDALTTTSSRFWGVTWSRKSKKWQAQYRDAAGKTRYIGHFDDEDRRR